MKTTRARLLAVCISVAVVACANDAWARDPWPVQVQKAAKEYAKEQAREYAKEQAKKQLVKFLSKAKDYMGDEYQSQMNALANAAISAANLEKFGDLMTSNDPKARQAAAEQLATVFGQAVQQAASKDATGGKFLDKLMGNLKDVKVVSSSLGAATGGDTTPALRFLGSKFLALTPVGGVVNLYQGASGVVGLAKDEFKDSTAEELYQEYQKVLAKDGPKAAEDAIRLRIVLPSYASFEALSTADMRKEREEAMRSTGAATERILQNAIGRDEFMNNLCRQFAARHAKEVADKKTAEETTKAEKHAEYMLNRFNDEMILKHGPDWVNTRDVDLKGIMDRIGKLMNETGLSLEDATQLVSSRFANGPNSKQYQDLLAKINESRRSRGLPPIDPFQQELTPEQIAAVLNKLPRGVVTEEDLEKFLKVNGAGLAQKSQQAIRDEFRKRREKWLEQVAAAFRRLEAGKVDLSCDPPSPVQGNPTEKNRLAVTVTAADGNLVQQLDALRNLGRRLAGVEPTISVRDQWSYLGKKLSTNWPEGRSQKVLLAKIDKYPMQVTRTMTVSLSSGSPAVVAAFHKSVAIKGTTTIVLKAGGPIALAGRWIGTLSIASLVFEGGAGTQGCDLTNKVRGKPTTLTLDIQGSPEAGTAVLTASPIQGAGQGSNTTGRLNYRVVDGVFRATGPIQQGTMTLTGRVQATQNGTTMAGSWTWSGSAGEGGTARGSGSWSVGAPKARK